MLRRTAVVLSGLSLVLGCSTEAPRYGFELPAVPSDGFFPIGVFSDDTAVDSLFRQQWRLVLAEALDEPSLLEQQPGITLRTWFLAGSDSAPMWVAVRATDLGNQGALVVKRFPVLTRPLDRQSFPPAVRTDHEMTLEELSALRRHVAAARLWDMPSSVPKTGILDTECADCREPHCEVELRDNARYHLVHRSHSMIASDTVGLHPRDARFYALCRHLRSLAGGGV